MSVTDQNQNNDKDMRKEMPASEEEPMFIPGDARNTYLPPLPNEGDEEALDAQKSKFRRIWDRYSYSAVRIYLTQFAMGIFGASLALATGNSLGAWSIAAGVFSFLFFAVLNHTTAWDIGSSDRISVDGGRRKRNLFTGVFVGLAAGIPNFFLAILFTVSRAFEVLHPVAAVTKVVAMFSEGMYWSFISNITFDGTPTTALHQYWWTYFVMALCTVALVGISYILGYYNVGLPKMLTNQGVEAERAEREKKQYPKQK